jgi:proliferating cell nuclear antigen PCNA
MTIIFKAKTNEGYTFKVLAELLQSNIKTGCFEINKKGIYLRMMDNQRTVLIDLKLEAGSFSVYKFKPKTNLYLGFNLNHFHKMLKSIKKRDSIQLYIDDAKTTELGITVIPKESNRVTTSWIKIQNIQNLEIDIPKGYNESIIVASSEFQKMCKGLSHISNTTKIQKNRSIIKFISDDGGVMKRCTDFGEQEDTDEEQEDTENTQYNEEFETEQLTKIIKLSGLSPKIQVYPLNDSPLLFRAAVGTLGKISIYLKSKNLLADESRAVEDEED